MTDVNLPDHAFIFERAGRTHDIAAFQTTDSHLVAPFSLIHMMICDVPALVCGFRSAANADLVPEHFSDEDRSSAGGAG
jgi:hypothetical protein